MSCAQFYVQFNIIIRTSQHFHVCGEFMWVYFHSLWMHVRVSVSSQLDFQSLSHVTKYPHVNIFV